MAFPHVYLNNNNTNVNLISGILSQPLESFSSFNDLLDNGYRFNVDYVRSTQSNRNVYNTDISNIYYYGNNMNLNYINIEDIDITGGDIKRIERAENHGSDTNIKTQTLDLPFIFPLFLGELTTHGIRHRENHNYFDVNFYETDFFQTHNADAYDVFYDFQAANSDLEKEKVGMINTNMQYCFMTYHTLHQYFLASNEWEQKDTTVINTNIQEGDLYAKHLNQRGGNTAHRFAIFEFDVLDGNAVTTYNTLNTLWTTLTRNEAKALNVSKTTTTTDNFYPNGFNTYTGQYNSQGPYSHTTTNTSFDRIGVDSDLENANTLVRAPDTFLFRYYSNRFQDVINMEIQRGTTITTGRDASQMKGGTRVNFNSIDIHSSIEGGDEFIYVSYIANVTVELKNTILCGVGTYPKLLQKSYGLSIDYITKIQSFLYTAEVEDINGVNTMDDFNFNPLNNLYDIEYNIPMIAKFKTRYSYDSDGLRRLNLDIVDTAAMNQFVTNGINNFVSYYAFGDLTDKQFVKAPFRLGEEAYRQSVGHRNGGSSLSTKWGDVSNTILSSIPMPYLQYMTSSSILDLDNDRFVVAWYASKDQHWNTIAPLTNEVTSGYGAQVRGDMIAINVYDTTQPFDKMTPESYVIDNISNLNSLQFIMHNGKYYLATVANKTGKLQELTYTGSGFTSVELYPGKFKNIDSLNIAGLKDGDLE